MRARPASWRSGAGGGRRDAGRAHPQAVRAERLRSWRCGTNRDEVVSPSFSTGVSDSTAMSTRRPTRLAYGRVPLDRVAQRAVHNRGVGAQRSRDARTMGGLSAPGALVRPHRPGLSGADHLENHSRPGHANGHSCIWRNADDLDAYTAGCRAHARRIQPAVATSR
jgi:hypothetical protein